MRDAIRRADAVVGTLMGSAKHEAMDSAIRELRQSSSPAPSATPEPEFHSA
jgi:hypothetical protein